MPRIKTSKEEVLQKVITTVRKKGIANSSMSELAKECGIQKSHFYYYFESKDTLIKDMLASVNSYMQYKLHKIISQPNASPKDKLAELDTLIFKLFFKNDGGCVMANTALESAHANPLYFDEIKNFFENFIGGIKQLLIDKMPPSKAQEMAEQIVQDIEGGILLMRVYKDKKYLENAIRRMHHYIIN